MSFSWRLPSHLWSGVVVASKYLMRAGKGAGNFIRGTRIFGFFVAEPPVRSYFTVQSSTTGVKISRVPATESRNGCIGEQSHQRSLAGLSGSSKVSKGGQ